MLLAKQSIQWRGTIIFARTLIGESRLQQERQSRRVRAEAGCRGYGRRLATLRRGARRGAAPRYPAISWVKSREGKTKPPKAWEETREAFTARMRGIVQEVNASCDVEGLCYGFLKRLGELVERKGARLHR